MIITLIIMIPITALVVGFLVLKSVQLGLRWQYEMTHEQKPTMESPVKPIVERIEQKQETKTMVEQQNILSEWINGPEEKR